MQQGLVLGGDPFYERTIAAVRLALADAAPIVIFSGGGGEGDSGASLAAVARRMGLPESKIRIENASYSTHENMVRSAPFN